MPDKALMARYDALKAKVVRRKQEFGDFVAMMERGTSWLVSPASTRFHLCVESGLLQHSVGVTETMLKLRAALAPEISEESCVICGLFHDAGKVGMPGKPLYLPNPDDWQRRNRGINYVYNDEVTTMGLAVRSLYLIAKYVPLSDAEAQAICYHDGQYIDDNHVVAQGEQPLTLLLHYADYWTMRTQEDGVAPKEDGEWYRRR